MDSSPSSVVVPARWVHGFVSPAPVGRPPCAAGPSFSPVGPFIHSQPSLLPLVSHPGSLLLYYCLPTSPTSSMPEKRPRGITTRLHGRAEQPKTEHEREREKVYVKDEKTSPPLGLDSGAPELVAIARRSTWSSREPARICALCVVAISMRSVAVPLEREGGGAS